MARKRKQEEPTWIDDIRRQDDNGHEVVDPNPVAIPAGFKRPETLAEQVRRLVRMERIADDGQVDENWDEANDFLVDDDFDPKTPWETIYDEQLGREVTPDEFQQNWPQLKEEMARKLRNHYRLIEQAEQEEQLLNKTRGAGVSPAPSQAPKEPSAEPQKPA